MQQTDRAKSAKTAGGNAYKSLEKSIRIGFATLIAIVLALWVSTQNASAREFPQCGDEKIQSRILKDFNWAEGKTWQRGFELTRLSKMHEHRTVQYDGSIVSRRYCMARAHLSNGRHRSIYYMINNLGGFVGYSWKVTHCVIGLDPWRNHDGYCRAIR